MIEPNAPILGLILKILLVNPKLRKCAWRIEDHKTNFQNNNGMWSLSYRDPGIPDVGQVKTDWATKLLIGLSKENTRKNQH